MYGMKDCMGWERAEKTERMGEAGPRGQEFQAAMWYQSEGGSRLGPAEIERLCQKAPPKNAGAARRRSHARISFTKEAEAR